MKILSGILGIIKFYIIASTCFGNRSYSNNVESQKALLNLLILFEIIKKSEIMKTVLHTSLFTAYHKKWFLMILTLVIVYN